MSALLWVIFLAPGWVTRLQHQLEAWVKGIQAVLNVIKALIGG